MRQARKPVGIGWFARFHAPVDARVVAVFRIALGLELVLRLTLLLPWVRLWYGPEGVMTEQAARAFSPRSWSLFWVLPDSDVWVLGLWGLMWLAAVAFLVGYRARIAAVSLFVLWVSFWERGMVASDAGDTLLRSELLLSIFMPLGHRFSVDARQGRTGDPTPSGLALRLLRLQMVYIYLMAGLAKLIGPPWREGTAMASVFMTEDYFGNLWVPDAFRYMPLVWMAISWGTLAAEHILPVTLWIPRLRQPSLAIAIVFHLGLLWVMNIPHFQLCMIAGWLSFCDWEEDVVPGLACVRKAKGRLVPRA